MKLASVLVEIKTAKLFLTSTRQVGDSNLTNTSQGSCYFLLSIDGTKQKQRSSGISENNIFSFLTQTLNEKFKFNRIRKEDNIQIEYYNNNQLLSTNYIIIRHCNVGSSDRKFELLDSSKNVICQLALKLSVVNDDDDEEEPRKSVVNQRTCESQSVRVSKFGKWWWLIHLLVLIFYSTVKFGFVSLKSEIDGLSIGKIKMSPGMTIYHGDTISSCFGFSRFCAPHYLHMHESGALILYKTQPLLHNEIEILWKSPQEVSQGAVNGLFSRGNYRASIQGDRTVVIYKGNKLIWSEQIGSIKEFSSFISD